MKNVLIFTGIILSLSFAFANGTVDMGVGTDILSLFQKFIEILYLLFWPLLVLSSKLLTNTFVYGGAFHIDTILWKLWQVIRVVANYFIGFIFLFSIFVYFFKSESNFSWKKLFPKIVVAAIVANLSWFIIGVLLDISSLLIYAFGDLATTFKKQIAKIGNQEKELIIVPAIYTGENIYVQVNNQSYQPCVFPLDENGSILDKPSNGPCFTLSEGTYKFYNANGETENIDLSNLKIKIPKDTPLFSLFKYVYTQFFISNNISNTSLAIIYFSKLFLFFILIVPLFVLAIILMARILILWVVIPFSPLIFSAYILGVVPSNYKEKFVDIISLIFQPAYVMFMLGIGFVLIESVYQMEPAENRDKLYNVFNIEEVEGENEVKIGDFAVIKGKVANGKFANGTSWSTIFDYFNWLLVNLLSGFVLRSLVFTALKSNKFTEKIATTVDVYTKKTAETLPIFPDGHSLASLQQAWGRVSTDLPDQLVRNQYLKLQQLSEKKSGNDKKEDNN